MQYHACMGHVLVPGPNLTDWPSSCNIHSLSVNCTEKKEKKKKSGHATVPMRKSMTSEVYFLLFLEGHWIAIGLLNSQMDQDQELIKTEEC